MIKVERMEVTADEFRLSNISFEIPTGQYGVLMGKTGSGKTTILEAICGLKQIVNGKVFLGSVDVTNARSGARGIGFVPQESTLFSTMTVRNHLSFGPGVQGWKKESITERVNELAEQLDIEDLLDRKPRGLSGGERQRVSLGRALAVKPAVLCLDEPLTALDEDTHEMMIGLIGDLVKKAGITALHVTHSKREAESLADRVINLTDGLISQSS